MILYVVTYTDYDEYDIYGIFENETLANAYKEKLIEKYRTSKSESKRNKMHNLDIEEFVLNEEREV